MQQFNTQEIQQTKQPESKNAGQVTIFMLALALALLTALPMLAAIGQLVITQQRLNAAADASALAGALELEFNQIQACETARNFNVNYPKLVMNCEASESRIKVILKLPNPVAAMRYLLPNLEAIATAGIAQPMESMP